MGEGKQPERPRARQSSGRPRQRSARVAPDLATRLTLLEERVALLEQALRGPPVPEPAPAPKERAKRRCPGCHLPAESIVRGRCPWCGFLYEAMRVRRKSG